MCGLLDKALPVIGGVLGAVVGGPAGAAIGAGLGGFAGDYAQTHNFGGSLLAGGISAGTSYLGGELSQGLGAAGTGASNIGETGNSWGFTGGLGGPADASDALESLGLNTGAAQDLAANTAANTGSMESGLGGVGLYGSNAGTGTVLGDQTAGSLGGVIGNNGIADATATTGLINGGTYTQGLGGGTGTLGQSSGTLGSTQGAVGMTGSGGVSGGNPNPQQPQDLSQAVSSNPTNMGSGAIGTDGSQAIQQAGGANPALMAQTGVDPSQSGLSTMYGANSTAGQSPMGASVANAGSTPGQVSYSSIPGTGGSMGDDGSGFSWNSPQGLSTLFKLGNTGLGMYQQYQAGQNAKNYAGQINQEFAPDSPYAQQMQQTLARQDAAAGRNSQYGNRAVQLAAALTQARAQALGNTNYYNATQNNARANMLNGLFSNFSSPQNMQGLYNMGSAGFNGLSSLFGG